MSLIATNKILEYIQKYPEARIPMLTWLKDFPYRSLKREFVDHKGKPLPGCGGGEFGVDTVQYWIKYIVNHAAKTYRITWIGNQVEHSIETDREIKEVLEKYSEVVEKYSSVVTGTESVTVTVAPPPPSIFPDPEWVSFTFKTIEGGISTVKSLKLDPLDIYLEPVLPEGKGFHIKEEYEQALSRAETLFESEPGTPEFDELVTLLPLIQDFENYKLKFPVLHNFEILKNRLDLFHIKPGNLPAAAGSEEDINLFLSGQLELPDEIVDQMFKIGHLRIPMEDKRFAV